MSNPEIAILMLGSFIFIIMLGFPIAFTLMAMGVGFGYYAKAKGRSILWGLCGFLSLLGLLILALLKDKSGDPWNT